MIWVASFGVHRYGSLPGLGYLEVVDLGAHAAVCPDVDVGEMAASLPEGAKILVSGDCAAFDCRGRTQAPKRMLPIR